MQIPLIQIGKSKGIRLSKSLLSKYRIADKVELVLQEDCIVLKPIARPRQGWDQAFAEMHQNGDDKLLIDSVLDDKDWDEQ